MTKKKESGGEIGFGGLFKGLADLIEKLGELAEKGEQLKKSGEFQHRDVKGVYGFSVKMGLGEKGDHEVKVEPFGNVRRDEKSGETVVQEIREPVVDVFEEKDHTLVVAEMPGISTGDVHLEVKDDLLTIYAEKKDKKYRKEILLPRNYPLEKMKMSCNNGILKIRCTL
ncbi:MAG: Hsp20/alpha crystallin family protein [Deltaproteobacteria bacterium]|nr:Hsp20/alpha crystallin family protein [Deltaproteobacteria bacterium]